MRSAGEKTEVEGGWEGGGEAVVTKEGSIRASTRPGGFHFTTAEAKALLASFLSPLPPPLGLGL